MNLIKRIVERRHGRCDHAMRAASDRLDGPLPLRRRVGLALHLWTCVACARAVRQIDLTHHVLSQTPAISQTDASARLDEAARQRIREKLASEQKSG